jgi:nucleoside-diphosphate-sugar epimerase
VETVSEIIGMMRAAAPAGQPRLDASAWQVLADLTQSLIAAKPDAAQEHARFLAIGQRELCLPEAELDRWLRGATVLVTGGTGCIGSALMAELAARCPARLVSVSRGVTDAWPRQAGGEYRQADVRDRPAMDRLIAEVRPDVVFHVAAQRDPALAEVEVHRTVTTNLFGTRNVLAAAETAGVSQVVCASTGKALRPYSPEVYTASKRAAEWVASRVAARGELMCSAARFTHVLDNSLIYRRLMAWAGEGEGGKGRESGQGWEGGKGWEGGQQTVIRLHATDIAFYVQSAVESAQLLLLAGLGAQRGEFRVLAITDLGWPVSLLDVALGVLKRTGSATPIYFSGYDPGYEEVPFPLLYDPATAGDVSPLLNAFEAAAAVAAPCPGVDSFRLDMAADPLPAKLLTALEDVCERAPGTGPVRGALGELSWSLLDAALRAAPRRALDRAAALARSHRDVLGSDHRRVLEAICDSAAADPTGASGTSGPAGSGGSHMNVPTDALYSPPAGTSMALAPGAPGAPSAPGCAPGRAAVSRPGPRVPRRSMSQGARSARISSSLASSAAIHGSPSGSSVASAASCSASLSPYSRPVASRSRSASGRSPNALPGRVPAP